MKTKAVQLIAGILMLGIGPGTQAEVYRCVDDMGHVIFTQDRCGPAQQGEKVNLDGMDAERKPKLQVCKDVEKLANLIFPHIHETDSILDIYTDLGGRAYLSAGITAVTNYVFNFRYNPKARQSNVVALTYAKCLEGGFGRITKKDLPDWDKIKYKKKTPGPRHQEKPGPQREKVCREYDEKIKRLRERLNKAKDKSAKLQARVDLEYLEGQKRHTCNARPPGKQKKP